VAKLRHYCWAQYASNAGAESERDLYYEVGRMPNFVIKKHLEAFSIFASRSFFESEGDNLEESATRTRMRHGGEGWERLRAYMSWALELRAGVRGVEGTRRGER